MCVCLSVSAFVCVSVLLLIFFLLKGGGLFQNDMIYVVGWIEWGEKIFV